MKRLSFALALALALSANAFAEDIEIITDESALFGDETEADPIEVLPESGKGSSVAAFLKTEGIRWGGSFSGSFAPDWKMNDPWGDPALDSYGLDTNVAGSLFFDARPSEDFRVYGKMKTSWPFAVSADSGSGSVDLPNVQIFELFSDFNYKDSLFFRFGKHTVKWGVGYFFSPADVINIGAIDPLDPSAQREGPVSLRIHYPVLGTQTNLWAYAIMPQGADPKPEDIAGAAKVEFLLAQSWEMGLGAYYKYDHPPRAVLTASGSIWKLNVFGEAVGAWGSDKSFITGISPAIEGFITTEERKDELFLTGTAGFSYSNSTDNWSVMGQYLYDGEGYANADREALIEDARTIKAILTTLGMPASAYSNLLKGLIYDSGRHYAALNFSKTELFTDKLSVGLFAMANLSDFSGWARPAISWELFDKASLELGATFVFGGSDSEYVVLNDGASLTLGFTASLGSGSF